MSAENLAMPESEKGNPEVEGAKPDEPLGESGLKALNAEREARKAAEKSAAEALAKIKEFEDRDKSEAQRQQEALEQAQRELAELTVAKTRAEIANTKSIPADLLSGPSSGSQEDLEAFADALIAWRGEPAPQKLIIPNEGKSPSSNSFSPADAFAAAVEGHI